MKYTTLLVATLAFSGCMDAAAPPELAETSAVSAKATASTGGTVLPTFGGSSAVAEAINDAGIVVGIASEPNRSRTVLGDSYAARWVRSDIDGSWVVTRLGAAGGRARALNDAGDAVGFRGGEAVLWPATGGEASLGAGAASGINNAGIIVGASGPTAEPSTVAYVWMPDPGTSPATWTRHELPLLEEGGGAGAYAINESSEIVGGATRAGLFRAVIWMPVDGGWSAPIPREGTDESTGTSAGFGINDNGDVVGYARTCPPPTCNGRPYLWPANGGSFDLASLNPNANSGRSTGIATDGHVVGWVTVTRGSSGGPFSWYPGLTTLTDLGTGEARGINNRAARYGQEAVGFTQTSNGQSAIVWRIP